MGKEFTEVKYVHFAAMGQSSHDDWEDLFHYRVHQNWVGIGQFATYRETDVLLFHAPDMHGPVITVNVP